MPLWWEFTYDWRIPLTNGQQCESNPMSLRHNGQNSRTTMDDHRSTILLQNILSSQIFTILFVHFFVHSRRNSDVVLPV